MNSGLCSRSWQAILKAVMSFKEHDRVFGRAVGHHAIVAGVSDSRRPMWCIALLGALLLFPTPAMSAQQTESASPPEQDTDLPDVIRAWRHKDPPPEPQPGHKSIVVA